MTIQKIQNSLIVCDTYIEITGQTQHLTRDSKVKVCQFEHSSKKKKILLTLASIPKLKKNFAKVYRIKDSEA